MYLVLLFIYFTLKKSFGLSIETEVKEVGSFFQSPFFDSSLQKLNFTQVEEECKRELSI